MKPTALTLCAATLITAGCIHSASKRQPASNRVVEWAAYAHDGGGSKHSPAQQITRENVSRLHQVWRYRTGDFAIGDGMGRDETTPLYVDNMLFVSTPFGGVRAISGDTGGELWSFDAALDLSGNYGDFTNRGVSTWVDRTNTASVLCHRRIFIGTVDGRLIALDSKTGAPCTDFGTGGQIALANGILNNPTKGEYAVTSPPAIAGDLVIVGSTVADNRRASAPSGVVRAFDTRTGALRWSWDPVPRDSLMLGYDTWRGKNAHTTGAANAWSIISVDSERDMIFVPTGSASPDFFGGERLGQNLFANSVVALRASTGKMIWHYQVVHHDLWDYDVPAQPLLFTMHRDGRAIPALAQTTKMGFLFVLDRLTGKPLFPVEERAVPASNVAGEQASPTQPFPTLPLPLGPVQFNPAEVFSVSDSGKAWCNAQLGGVKTGSVFTPPSTVPTMVFPGNVGGSNWSGMALDVEHNVAIVPSNRLATIVELIPRDSVNGMVRGNRFDEYAPQAGTAFAMRRRHLISPDGSPCNPPPWGVPTAIDLETGKTKWERPMGSVGPLAKYPGNERWGSPNLGGALTTAGGLVFVSGAMDRKLHAYDVETGNELWSAELPTGAHAAPMTYVSEWGKQYVIVAAGGHRELRGRGGEYERAGDYVIAFALPDRGKSGDIAWDRAPNQPITTGKYEGHILLDRTRLASVWNLTVEAQRVTLSLETSGTRVTATGTGRVFRDTIVADLTWTLPERNCGGTLHLQGAQANYGTATIGELTYVDGCAGGGTKPGTFAIWKGGRKETTLAAPR